MSVFGAILSSFLGAFIAIGVWIALASLVGNSESRVQAICANHGRVVSADQSSWLSFGSGRALVVCSDGLVVRG